MAERKGRTLDLERYFPFLLTALSNKLSSSASQLYTRSFGVGVIEWRVLSGAAAAPGSRPNDVCQLVGIDKGAVAKALKTLTDQGLVATEANERDGRSKTIRLTGAGWALHERILTVALARQERLFEALQPEERDRLLDYMRRLLDRLQALKTETMTSE
jgi:DNA-binding MarR family transcriptional regulator